MRKGDCPITPTVELVMAAARNTFGEAGLARAAT
jgi:hypothetical protein